MLTAKFQKKRFPAFVFLIKKQYFYDRAGTSHKKHRKNLKKFSKNAKVLKRTADIIYVIAEKLKIPEAQVYIRADGNLLL